MRGRIRQTWIRLSGSYWFLPAVLTLLALALAFLTIELDRTWGSDWLRRYDWFASIQPDGARDQLSLIASAMIAVSSTVFAITIAAVAFASGTYGPRLLTNFMNDRGNQLSLGVFIATFVYNLVVLRVVRSAEDPLPPGEAPAGPLAAFVPQFSVLVSAGSAILAVVVLVYFLHHIPSSIRINKVIGTIGRRLIRDIERRFPAEREAAEPVQPISGTAITSNEIGYIEIIDFAGLDAAARDAGARLSLKVRTGDFISPHVPVMGVAGADPTPELQQRLLGCFSLGDSRTPTQDLEFLVDELVEITLRALSPGINDPFTAINSMHWMGAALARLAGRDLRFGPEQQTYDQQRVQPVCDDFEHFVRRSFGAVRASAATNEIASKMFVDVIRGVWHSASSTSRRRILMEEAEWLGRQAATVLAGPALEELCQRLAEFRNASAA